MEFFVLKKKRAGKHCPQNQSPFKNKKGEVL
jgi:hypothetical protein